MPGGSKINASAYNTGGTIQKSGYGILASQPSEQVMQTN